MEALALLEFREEFELMLSDLMMANWTALAFSKEPKNAFRNAGGDGHAVHDISVALAAIRNGPRLSVKALRTRTTVGHRPPRGSRIAA